MRNPNLIPDSRLIFFRLFKHSIVLALILLIPVRGNAESPTPHKQNNIMRIGVQARRGAEVAIQKWGPTADALCQAIPGYTFEIVPLVDCQEMRLAVESGSIDFVLTNPATYVELAVEFGISRLLTLNNLQYGVGSTEFAGVVFAREDLDDVKTLADIRGRSLMGVNEGSFGGWWMALREWKDLGLDPYSDCSEVLFSPDGTKEAVVRAVISGEVDIGTVRTGIIEDMIKRGELSAGSVKVLSAEEDDLGHFHSTRHYPEWPLAKMPQTPEDLVKQVTIVLLSMASDDQAAVGGSYRGWATPGSYGLVRELLQELRFGPYEDFGRVTFLQAIRQHWIQVLALVAVLVAIALFAAKVLSLNRRLHSTQGGLYKHRDHLEQLIAQQTEDLCQSERNYQAIAEDIPALITRFLPSGEITFVNQAYCEYFGRSSKELVGQKFLTLIPPEDQERVMSGILAMTVDSPTMTHEHPVIRPGGEICWQRWTNRALFDSEGNSVAFQSIGEDITEQRQMEEDLRQNEKMMRTVLNTTRDLVFLLNPDGTIALINESAAKNFGSTQEELVGKCPFDFGSADSTNRRWEVFREFVVNPRPLRFEDKNNGKYFDNSVYPVLDEAGNLRYGVVFAQNITERKNTEKALQDSEEKFRALYDNAPLSYQSLDEKGCFIDVNPAWLKTLGYTRDEVIGNNFGDFLHPDWGAHFEKNFPEFKRRGNIQDVQFKIRHKDNHYLDISFEGCIGYNPDGSFRQTYCVFHDITERKQAEDSRDRLTRAIEQSSETIVITDFDGNIQYANPAFEQVSGYTQEEAIGQNPRFLKSGKHEAPFYKEMWETILSGATWTGQITNQKKDGTLFIEEATISPVLDVMGRITNFVAVKRDITQDIKVEGQLRQALKMESVGLLAGGVAHDFNNMLLVIQGHTELALGQADPDGSFHSALTKIRDAADRSADLTRQLLAFARKQTIEPKVLDLNETVSGMLKMLGRLIGEDINLNWKPGGGLWPVKIDPSQIDQILANLCVNARDAIGGVGDIFIETENACFDDQYCLENPGAVPGDYTLLTVSDSGHGIDKEILENIFDPFFTTKQADSGTGLGLATVYGIVKQNLGFITVYSETGNGTTFRIYLPRQAGEIEPMLKNDPPKPARRGQETILLVEDETEILDLVTAMLDRQGYTTLAASTPGAAVRLAEAHPGEIHLLLTDVVMPEMNGRELATSLQPIFPDLKHLFMSGYSADVIAKQGVLDEGSHFIQKPFAKQNLLASVQEVLDQ